MSKRSRQVRSGERADAGRAGPALHPAPSGDIHLDWPQRSSFMLRVTGRDEPGEKPSTRVVSQRAGWTATATRYDLRPGDGQGHWTALQLAPGLTVVITSTTYANTIDVIAPGEGLVEFHCHLSGEMSLAEPDAPDLNLDRRHLLIQRQAPGCDVAERIRGGVKDVSVTIYCHSTTLRTLVGDAERALRQPLSELFADESDGILRMRLPLRRSISAPFVALVDARHDGPFGLARAEALTRLAICEIVSALSEEREPTTIVRRLSERDIACLTRARDLLHSHHAPPPTIAQLALHAGLSPTKLKSGFRTLYGKTIGSYADELRMSRALDLLQDRSASLAVIAGSLGYGFQSSFTSAFRRRFGVPPKDWRQIADGPPRP